MAFYIRARSLWTQYPHANLTEVDWQGEKVPRRLHHTADAGPRGGSKATIADELEFLRATERYHVQERDYNAIAYSYLVMPSGRVYEGRGFEKAGAHTLGHNSDIGICFAGNFQNRPPTKAAREGYLSLLRKLKEKGVDFAKVYPHCATYATACPGKSLLDAFDLDCG